MEQHVISGPAEAASAGLSLASEFPEFEVALVPLGPMWSAYWQSDDGRHRLYIVAPSAPALLAALRSKAGDTP